MEIIKSKVEELVVKTSYVCKEKYPDEQINTLLSYWIFFDEKETEIKDLLGVSLEDILYSKYYWCTKFKKRFNMLYGKDAGIDQQQYKIIEEMTQRIADVNWEQIQMIEDEICN